MGPRVAGRWPLYVLACGMAMLVGTARAHDIAVIGTGMMGSSLGTRLGAAGHRVIYGSRDPSKPRVIDLVTRTGRAASARTQLEAARAGEIVIIAVPWEATQSVVAHLQEALRGKVVIDITNAQRLNADDGLPEMAVATSAGELMQRWLPESKVVKAFNTVGFHVVAEPQRANGPVTVPVASNYPDAKVEVVALVKELGFEAMDAGPLRMARTLEELSGLYRVPHWSGRRNEAFEFYFRPVPEPTPAEFPVLLMERD